MRRVLLAAVLAMLGALSPAAEAAKPPGTYHETVAVGAGMRAYTLVVPTGYDGSHPLPLVFALHGFGGNAATFGAPGSTGLSDLAETKTFFAVYPQGTPTGPAYNNNEASPAWNSGINPDFDLHVDDVAFIRALQIKLAHELSVDPRRIFATGLSNGAGMTHRLGRAFPKMLAAIGVVAGAIGMRQKADEPDGPYLIQPPALQPMPAIIFHGLKDPNVLYFGGPSDNKELLDALPVSDSVDYWKNANHCAKRMAKQTDAAGNTTTGWTHCRAGADVVLHTQKLGLHQWPMTGNESNLDGNTLLWGFFRAHPRPVGVVRDAACTQAKSGIVTCTVTFLRKVRATAELVLGKAVYATGTASTPVSTLTFTSPQAVPPGSHQVIVRFLPAGARPAASLDVWL